MKTQFLNNSKLGIFIFAFVFFATTINAQTTVNNNPNTSADFTDLQTAIDAASNGDIIYVQQSPTSYGAITINKGLTIVGRSHSDSGYKTTVDGVTFAAGASNTTLKGLKISSVIEEGIGSTITDLKFFDNDISSFQLGSTDTFNNVLIQGNILRGSLYIYSNTSNVLVNNNIVFCSGVYLYNTATLLFSNNVMALYYGVNIGNSSTGLLNIDNCIFIGNYGVNNSLVTLTPGTGTIQINNCITYNYGSGSYDFSTGAGITINANNQENTDPLFTSVDPASTTSIAAAFGQVFDGSNDDLTLQAGSPVNDDGLFQGYNFKYFGTPTGIPSIKVDSYSSTVPKNSNLTVTITAKTN
ncbi:MAG: hypothetical protein QM478_04830 [Flavobacteriaceae bacterium]